MIRREPGGGARRDARAVVRVILGLLILLLLVACAGTPRGRPRDVEMEEPIVRQPDVLDHKNYAFGRDIPDWVFLEAWELEERRDYRDFYVFKFQSPRAQSLQGAEMWSRNFQAPRELVRIVRNRVEVKFQASAAGDLDRVDEYMEEVLSSVSSAAFSGYRPEADYWLQLRYYDSDGDALEDAYTYYVLYTIPREVLDRLVAEALAEADDDEVSEESRRVRERVKDAFANGL